jgi:hypothetical protein
MDHRRQGAPLDPRGRRRPDRLPRRIPRLPIPRKEPAMLTELTLTHLCGGIVQLVAGAWTTPAGDVISHCPTCGEWLGSAFLSWTLFMSCSSCRGCGSGGSTPWREGPGVKGSPAGRPKGRGSTRTERRAREDTDPACGPGGVWRRAQRGRKEPGPRPCARPAPGQPSARRPHGHGQEATRGERATSPVTWLRRPAWRCT